MRYVIEGEPVSGKNSMRIVWSPKRNRRVVVKSTQASAWQLSAIEQLVKQRGRTKTMRGDVCVALFAYQRDKRRDLDNVIASLLDALKKARVIEDDFNVAQVRATRYIVPNEPRIEVMVTPL